MPCKLTFIGSRDLNLGIFGDYCLAYHLCLPLSYVTISGNIFSDSSIRKLTSLGGGRRQSQCCQEDVFLHRLVHIWPILSIQLCLLLLSQINLLQPVKPQQVTRLGPCLCTSRLSRRNGLHLPLHIALILPHDCSDQQKFFLLSKIFPHRFSLNRVLGSCTVAFTILRFMNMCSYLHI